MVLDSVTLLNHFLGIDAISLVGEQTKLKMTKFCYKRLRKNELKIWTLCPIFAGIIVI